MRFKHTLILLVVTLALGAYVWFVERKLPTTQEAARKGNEIMAISRDEITALSIKNPESKIELRKDASGRWQMEEPVKDRADSGSAGLVTQLLDRLSNLRHDGVIDEKEGGVEKDFAKKAGVADTNTKVKIAREGKPPVEIHFGSDVPAGRKVYARLEGDKRIYVIPNELKAQVSKKADEFRDPRVSALTPQTVTKVELKTPAGEIELRKNKANRWSLTKPLTARGDEGQVSDLISRITAARVDQFAPDASNLAAFGLAEPRATIALSAEGTDQPEVLRIGGNPTEEKDKEKTWVQLSTRPSVMLVPKAIEQLLATQPNGLRDKHLVRIDSEAKSDIIDRVTIDPAGRGKIVLAREADGSWVRKDGDREVPINETIATRLLADFQSVLVTRFVEDVAANLGEFGLDQPAVKVTFSSYASENTAESTAGEEPIVSVHFGKIEGDHGYAKLDNEPFVVAVPRGIIDQIPTDPTELQPLGIYSFKPEEITTLEVTAEGKPPLSLDREKDGKWKLAKGDGNLNQTNVASFTNTLAALRAVRWVGQPKPEHGLDKPGIVVAFTAAQGDKPVSGKITVGAQTPEQFWAATAEGFPGVFLMSDPDRSALALAMLEQAAQPASAASSGTPNPTSSGTPAPTATPAQPPVPVPAPEAAAPAPAIDQGSAPAAVEGMKPRDAASPPAAVETPAAEAGVK